jgi:hypothetical protein
MIEYTVKKYDNKTEWWLNGKLHREDGPAREWKNGTKEWWLNGKQHRTDGPAIEWDNGNKEWWLNGKQHREDGPAVEYVSGYKAWWINGKRLTETEFNNRNKITIELTQDQLDQIKKQGII